MSKLVVTTSWDDGHVDDVRLATLLKKYGLQGTFYIAPRDHHIAPQNRLTPEQTRELSQDFEIGAHTMTHPLFSEISDAQVRAEMAESKTYLEKTIGRPVVSFCYPSGNFNTRHEKIVEEEGFILARTVRRFVTQPLETPFALDTTLHTYRHWSDLFPILGAVGPFKFLSCYLNWDQLAITLFDRALFTGGVFHLWGHSWEIDAHRDWDRLERVFAHISGHAEVHYKTNAELLRTNE